MTTSTHILREILEDDPPRGCLDLHGTTNSNVFHVALLLSLKDYIS